MKRSTFTCSCAMALFAALATPVRVVAQYHHYQVVDLGTLGGANSFITSPETGNVNRRGVALVEAETTSQDPYAPDCFRPDCVLVHALLWKNGSAIDLGALPERTTARRSGSMTRALPSAIQRTTLATP